MMAVTHTNNNNKQQQYDPMYCLSEHLDYFTTSVAGGLNLLECDFDEIFGKDLEQNVSLPPNKKAKLSSPYMASPLIPKFAPPSPPPSHIQSDYENLDFRLQQQERPVVSPATVTSTFSFAVEAAPIAPKESSALLLPATVYVTATTAVAGKPKKKTSKKRQVSDSSSCSETSSSPKSRAGTGEREGARRERNRQHAKRSRDRKREFFNALEQSVQEMKAENETLFDMLGISSADTSIVTQREEELQDASTKKFIDALKQPENRVLGDDALASLRELFN